MNEATSRGLASDEERRVALVSLMAISPRGAAARAALAGFYAGTDPRIGDALRRAGEAAARAAGPLTPRGSRPPRWPTSSAG